MNIICDKCGSSNVVDRIKTTPPEPQAQTMSEWINSDPYMTKAVPAVIRYTEMVLECKDCGHSIEHSVMS